MMFSTELRFSSEVIRTMRAGIQISSLVPTGLVIESVSDSSEWAILAADPKACGGVPVVRGEIAPIHSRCDRQAADLLSARKEMELDAAHDDETACIKWIIIDALCFADAYGLAASHPHLDVAD